MCRRDTWNIIYEIFRCSRDAAVTCVDGWYIFYLKPGTVGTHLSQSLLADLENKDMFSVFQLLLFGKDLYLSVFDCPRITW